MDTAHQALLSYTVYFYLISGSTKSSVLINKIPWVHFKYIMSGLLCWLWAQKLRSLIVWHSAVLYKYCLIYYRMDRFFSPYVISLLPTHSDHISIPIPRQWSAYLCKVSSSCEYGDVSTGALRAVFAGLARSSLFLIVLHKSDPLVKMKCTVVPITVALVS